MDLGQGEAFGFLGFDFRRVRSLRGRWRPQYTPKLTQRTALLEKLKELFRRYDSQPVGRVITEINPILRGWVNLLSDRERGPVPGLRDELGGEEGAAPSDASEASCGLRLDEVEYGGALRGAGVVP